MTGQELAAKLRDLGFSQIKSHMTALSDFEVLEIQARLEAYGIVGESSAQVTTVGGLKIKRKRKAPTPHEPELHEEPEPEEEPPRAKEPEPQPVAEEPPPSEPGELEPDFLPEIPVDPEPASAQAEEPEPLAPSEPEVETEIAEPLVAEVREEEGEPEPVQAEPEEAPAEAFAETELAVGEPATGAEIVRPSAKRRSGKVVGFIDPSQFQRQAVPRTESRRLRSTDDVVPEVMPTLGRDRHAGVVRGDTTRGTLTAQELRERESGRFLRRRRAQAQVTGGRKGGSPKLVDPSTGSPFVGGAVEIDSPITLKKLANTLAVKVDDDEVIFTLTGLTLLFEY